MLPNTIKRNIPIISNEFRILNKHKIKINKLRFEYSKALESSIKSYNMNNYLHPYSKLKQFKVNAYKNLLSLEETEVLLEILNNSNTQELCEHYDVTNFSEAIFKHYIEYNKYCYDKEKVNHLNKIYSCNYMLQIMEQLEKIRILNKIY